MTQSSISRVGSSPLPTQPCSYPELVGTREIWHHWFQSRTLKIFRIIQRRHFVIFTKEIRCQPDIEKTHYHNDKPLPCTSTVLDWSETPNEDCSLWVSTALNSGLNVDKTRQYQTLTTRVQIFYTSLVVNSNSSKSHSSSVNYCPVTRLLQDWGDSQRLW